MNFDDYKLVIYRNQPDGWVAEIPAISGSHAVMPGARAAELPRVAAKLCFERARKTGSHELWRHKDGRSTTILIHGEREIGTPLFYLILDQLGINLEKFENLR